MNSILSRRLGAQLIRIISLNKMVIRLYLKLIKLARHFSKQSIFNIFKSQLNSCQLELCPCDVCAFKKIQTRFNHKSCNSGLRQVFKGHKENPMFEMQTNVSLP